MKSIVLLFFCIAALFSFQASASQVGDVQAEFVTAFVTLNDSEPASTDSAIKLDPTDQIAQIEYDDHRPVNEQVTAVIRISDKPDNLFELVLSQTERIPITE